jgi:hypothetical protein
MSWRLSAAIFPSMNAFCPLTFPWTMPISVSADVLTMHDGFAGGG